MSPSPGNGDPSLRERIFRALTSLYPRSFRDEFEDEMHQVLRADHDSRSARGDRRGFWLRTLRGVLLQAPREHLSDLGMDLRYALRTLRRRPFFVAVAVLSMGLAIGASTLAVATLSTLFLSPVPGLDAAEDHLLINVKPYSSKLDGFDSASFPDFDELRSATTTLESIAAFQGVTLTAKVAAADEPEPQLGQIVTPSYFEVLGLQPSHGRLFSSDEERQATGVVVVSDWFWRSRLDSRLPLPALWVNGRELAVVGVGPPAFRGNFKGFACDLFLPLGMGALVGLDPAGFGEREVRSFELIGRLAPGYDIEAATVEMQQLGKLMAQNHPAINADLELQVEAMTGLDADLRGGLLVFLSVLLVATLLILVIAALNISGMMASRAAQRATETAVRQALGAPRHRLQRQMMVESLVLGTLAAMLGTSLAMAGTDSVARAFQSVDSRIAVDVSIDGMALGAAVGMALLVMILATVASGSASMRGSLVRNQRGTAHEQRWRRVLVLAQVVLSFTVLVTAALFLRALDQASELDMGFDPVGVATASLNPTLAQMSGEETQEFFSELRREGAELPGVEHAGLITTVPLSLGARFFANRAIVNVAGHQPPPDSDGFAIEKTAITEGVLAALRIEVLEGRGIERSDHREAAPVVVVNESFVERFFSGDPTEALAAEITVDGREHRVVGVARNSKYRRLDESDMPFFFQSLSQVAPSRAVLLARSSAGTSPSALLPPLRQLQRRLAPDLPVRELQPLDQRLASALLPQRVGAMATGVLGVLGLVLSAMGMAGVLAQWVEARRKEIGLRMSVGAAPRQVLAMVLRQGSSLTALGVVIGLPLALGLSRLLRGFLYGVSPLDPFVYALAGSGMVLTALVACTFPALRALRVDPLAALRSE